MSIIDDFKDINRRMNRKPVIAATYGIPAETTELKPELFTSEEGGMWRSWSDFHEGDCVHSIMYKSGEIWDQINGMRRPTIPYSQLVTAIGQFCLGNPFELPDLRHVVPNIEKDRNGPNG